MAFSNVAVALRDCHPAASLRSLACSVMASLGHPPNFFLPIIRYLEVSIRRDSGKLDKFEKFERNLVLYLDTIMRFTQNDLFRRRGDDDVEPTCDSNLSKGSKITSIFTDFLSHFCETCFVLGLMLG